MVFLEIDTQDFLEGKPLTEKPEPPRGQVLDVNGNLLATSVRRPSLVANPQQVNKPREAADYLARRLDSSVNSLYQKLTEERYFVWLARKMSEANVKKLKPLNFEGLRFQPEYERVYPQGKLAASVLGFVGIDNQGLGGVEKQYNDLLRQVTTPDSSVKQADSRTGKSVSIRLTIDQTIQHIAEEELSRVVQQENPEDAMVLVIESRTGRIRAMANWPSFNPNNYRESPAKSRRNRIISDVFEPGSTLKPVNMAIGLEEGSFQASSKYRCRGYIYLPQAKHTIHCRTNHGVLSIPEIIIQSCNVGAIKATRKIPPTQYYTRLRRFGFGTWSGIRLPGESRGILERPSEWSSVTQSSMAIGQGLAATALQLTNALSVLVNDGILMKPRIVSSINPPGLGHKRVEPFQVRRVISREIARDIQHYMQDVVAEGTGKRAQIKRVKLGGKTGTAQKPNRKEGGYYQDKFFASFVGFGPVSKPKLVVGVFFDDPKDHQYGGNVAAPLFRRVMKRSLRYLRSRSNQSKFVSE